MEFALLNDARDAVLKYPLEINRFLRKLYDMRWSPSLDVEALTSGRVVPVVETAKPADSHLYRIVKVAPVESGGVWEQQWQTVMLDPAEQTRKLNQAKLAKWKQAKAIGDGLRTGYYDVGPGLVSLTGMGFARIVMMGVSPGARVVELEPDANGIEKYFSASAQQVANTVDAISDYFDAIAAREYALQQSIKAAANFIELNAIDNSAGWPG